MDNEYKDVMPSEDLPLGEPTDFQDVVKEFKEKVTKKVKKTIDVRLATSTVFSVGGKQRYLVVSVDEPLRGFLVDVDNIQIDKKLVQQIVVDESIEAYDWSGELEKMLPDIETIRKNVLMSFWRAGAFDKLGLKTDARRHLFDTAFPYRLEEAIDNG